MEENAWARNRQGDKNCTCYIDTEKGYYGYGRSRKIAHMCKYCAEKNQKEFRNKNGDDLGKKGRS